MKEAAILLIILSPQKNLRVTLGCNSHEVIDMKGFRPHERVTNFDASIPIDYPERREGNIFSPESTHRFS